MSDPIKVQVQLAFYGWTKDTAGKKASRWFQIRDGKIAANANVYSAQCGKAARPGCVYTFDATSEDASSIYPDSRRFHSWLADDVRTQWEGAFEEEERAAEAKKTPAAMQELLAPLRNEYKKRIGYAARAAYLAKVIAYVTG
jgi:hypothetical protein